MEAISMTKAEEIKIIRSYLELAEQALATNDLFTAKVSSHINVASTDDPKVYKIGLKEFEIIKPMLSEHSNFCAY